MCPARASQQGWCSGSWGHVQSAAYVDVHVPNLGCLDHCSQGYITPPSILTFSFGGRPRCPNLKQYATGKVITHKLDHLDEHNEIKLVRLCRLIGRLQLTNLSEMVCMATGLIGSWMRVDESGSPKVANKVATMAASMSKRMAQRHKMAIKMSAAQ